MSHTTSMSCAQASYTVLAHTCICIADIQPWHSPPSPKLLTPELLGPQLWHGTTKCWQQALQGHDSRLKLSIVTWAVDGILLVRSASWLALTLLPPAGCQHEPSRSSCPQPHCKLLPHNNDMVPLVMSVHIPPQNLRHIFVGGEEGRFMLCQDLMMKELGHADAPLPMHSIVLSSAPLTCMALRHRADLQMKVVPHNALPASQQQHQVAHDGHIVPLPVIP